MKTLLPRRFSKLVITERFIYISILIIFVNVVSFQYAPNLINKLDLASLYLNTLFNHNEFCYFHLAFLVCSLGKFCISKNCGANAIYEKAGILFNIWTSSFFMALILSSILYGNTSLVLSLLCYWYVFGLLLLFTVNYIFYFLIAYLHKHGFKRKHVLIIGYGNTGREIHKRILNRNYLNILVKAIVSDDEKVETVSGVPIFPLTLLNSINEYIYSQKIDQIWIALDEKETIKLPFIRRSLCNTLTDIQWIPGIENIQMYSNKFGSFMGFPAIDLKFLPFQGNQYTWKNFFDKMAAAVAIILLLPLFITISIIIALNSPGPIFDKKPSKGLGGKIFNAYTFRTAITNQSVNSGIRPNCLTREHTSIGRFINQTGLDVLPQFFNVIIGQMSIVGPRLLSASFNSIKDEQSELYALRGRIKPGMTGLAQIYTSARASAGELDNHALAMGLKHDVHYILNWSFTFDLKIIMHAINRRLMITQQ
jgi:putative colanic acid biosynthesis UDP-glucose lipid carrier transferase